MAKIHVQLNNGANAVRQAAATTASFVARKALYASALSQVGVAASDEELLRMPYGVADNEVLLQTKDGKLSIRITDAVIKVEQQKKIVSAALLNRSGTVKEYVQDGDYVVTISGSLIGEQGKFPYDDLNRTLVPLVECAENLEIFSAYTNAFGIMDVVLTSATFDQNQMRLFNVMPFELKFLSDRNYEFLVEE